MTAVAGQWSKTTLAGRYFAALAMAVAWLAGEARAQSAPAASVAPSPTIVSWLPQRGDPFGTRQWLEEHGVSFGVVYTNEVLSNLRGGIRRGTIFEGKVEAAVGVDLGRVAGLDGLSFYSNSFQLHGASGPGRILTDNLNTISNIEAIPTTRLSELWLEQKFWGDKISLRAGQLVVDTEFLFSQYFSYFMSSDWPTNPAINIPSGGPAYPLSTPGIRLKIDPTPQTTALLAVFNGDPAGPGPNDSLIRNRYGYHGSDGTGGLTVDEAELRNRYGLNFRVKDPPLVIGEVQYRYNQQPDTPQLAGGVRFGGWHHFGRFSDIRFDANGLSQADPLSGDARRYAGNQGVYAVWDQQLYRPRGGDAFSGVTAFGRVAYSPPNRNLNDLYIDGGVIFAGFLSHRPSDSFGVSLLYARMSKAARELDRDTRLFTGLQIPLRSYELSAEISYTAPIMPGWVLQPNLAVVINPGGRVPDLTANSPEKPIRNAVLIGMRSVIKY